MLLPNSHQLFRFSATGREGEGEEIEGDLLGEKRVGESLGEASRECWCRGREEGRGSATEEFVITLCLLESGAEEENSRLYWAKLV